MTIENIPILIQQSIEKAASIKSNEGGFHLFTYSKKTKSP